MTQELEQEEQTAEGSTTLPGEKPLEQVLAEKQAEKDRKAAEKQAEKNRKAADKAQIKADKEAKKAAGKAAPTDGEPSENKSAKTKDERNGVTRPGSGVTLDVWIKADELSKKIGAAVDRATLTEVLRGAIEIGTIHTQYGRWRKYYGLSETRDARRDRLAKIREAKETAKAQEKAEKDQQRAQQLAAVNQENQQESAEQSSK
jgi:hypothetical protein